MLRLKALARRLYDIVSRAAAERELDEELRFHLEMRAADNVAAGMSPEEAAADARHRFGDVGRIKKLCREAGGDKAPRKVLLVSLWLAVVCGAALWANRGMAQVSVLGEMLVLTAVLCRLLVAIRATRLCDAGPESGVRNLVSVIEPARRQSRSHRHYGQGDRRLMGLGPSLTLICAASLCVVVATASGRSLAIHICQTQAASSTPQPAAEKFVGTWTTTVADMSGGKDAPAPPPFQGLPSDLLVAEVTLKIDGGRLTGTRVLYSYNKSADGSPVVAEKGEVELTDIKFDGHVLTGGVATPDGDKLPGGWEMKLTGEDEAEVRLTGSLSPS